MGNATKPLPRTAPFDIAFVREESMTDNSVAFNVHILRHDDGVQLCKLACVDQSAARELAEQINDAACYAE